MEKRNCVVKRKIKKNNKIKKKIKQNVMEKQKKVSPRKKKNIKIK